MNSHAHVSPKDHWFEMPSFNRIELSDYTIEDMSKFSSPTVGQLPEWLEFVADTQNAEIVVLEIHDGSSHIGYFVGLIAKTFGMRVLGSPFRGWTTTYMGFNLADGINPAAVLPGLIDYAFNELSCIHVEITDRQLTAQDCEKLGIQHEIFRNFEMDLTQSEEKLFANMTSKCRGTIRQAQKKGVVISEADEAGFAEEFYAQLKDVYAKRKLIPSYDIERVRKLIKHLHPKGDLLLLCAHDPVGNCIATGIFPGAFDRAFGWGSVSWRHSQSFRPNEIIIWHAMKYWKGRGKTYFDTGGPGDHKKKYGVTEIATARVQCSKYKVIDGMRLLAQNAMFLGRKIQGAFSKSTPRG